MGKRHEETLLQRRHPDGEQPQEKILNSMREVKIKNSRIKCWQECGTKGTLVYLLVGIPTGIASKENSVEILSKVKNRSTL